MEVLNTQLLRFFDWLLWASLQGTVLIVLIVLIQIILRRRLPVRWHYIIWLLLLIRLAIPWLPESKMSIFNLVPRSVQQGRIIESFAQSRSAETMGFYMHARSASAPQTTEESETFSVKFVRMLPALWFVGTVLLAGYVCMRSINMWRTVKRERPITDSEILDLLEDCKMQMGVETILAVVVSDKIKSPALFGFIRPRLLLPQGMLETYGLEELRYVFIHELGHLKQRDIYLGWVMALLQVVHWFNPLMWFAFGRMRADREMACDRLVISTMGPDEPPKYGRTIVSLLESFSQVRYLPSVAGILEDTCQIERRIKMIADYKKTPRSRWAGAMLLVAVLACVVLTNAYVAKADFMFGIPTNLGSTVNSSALDITVSISADELSLFFTSDRPGGFGGWDIWITTRATTGDPWGEPVNLGPLVNSSAFDWTPSISADGLALYFNSDRPGGSGWNDIYVTTRVTKDDPWEEPVNLGPPVNSSANDFFPSISSDSLSLYFGSSRSGGFGMDDIYVSTRATTDDPWGEPMNLGQTVNTSGKDGFPSISADGLSLFCASFQAGGVGKDDLWVTTRATKDDDWGTPVNLGPAVNSPDGEGAPSISFDGSTLYFYSDRPGGFGLVDIWQVSILPVVDLNGDGKVDLKDLRKLAQYWGQNEPSCDIAPLPNGDGIVDDQDLMVLAQYLLEELQPVAHWKLDETDGYLANDSAGKNDGYASGGPVWQPDGGKLGGALLFDGADDSITVPFFLDPGAGSFSVFAWIKDGAPGQVIISQADGTGSGSRWLWADPSYGRLMSWLMHPTFDPLVSEKVITDGHWHHVGLVYDLDKLHRYLYVDGKEVAKDTDYVGVVDSNGGLYFGANKTFDAAAFWSGLIDDIRIYDEVLSVEEVAELAR
ncbi:MAG: M56 family metallopeptidase [Sedimentisphaerales bacterium]